MKQSARRSRGRGVMCDEGAVRTGRLAAAVVVHPYFFSWQKRVFDVVVGGVWLVFALPLMGLIAGLIWAVDGRPVLFRQLRAGQGRQPFVMWKFRTMVVGAEAEQTKLASLNIAPAPFFKAENDPRLTRLGRFLRRFGLDELPQLWQVIKGEMSLVGPRPVPVGEAKQLGKEWEFRFMVKPGIFSEWSAVDRKLVSKIHWRKLELITVVKGSGVNDLVVILKTLKFTLPH